MKSGESFQMSNGCAPGQEQTVNTSTGALYPMDPMYPLFKRVKMKEINNRLNKESLGSLGYIGADFGKAGALRESRKNSEAEPATGPTHEERVLMAITKFMKGKRKRHGRY